MIFGFCRRGKIGAWLLVGWVAMAALRLGAADEVVNTRDTLAFKDGDRVQGTLVQNADGEIVFKSDRFGELRVKSADAVVIKAEKPEKAVHVEAKGIAAAAAKPTPGNLTPDAPTRAETAATQPDTAAERAEAERVSVWDRFSPSVLTAHVRNFFGPWHGRLAFSTEVVNDVANRNNDSLEAKLTRKWQRDAVQLSARYDYARTNDVPTTDVVKGSGSWRHEFNKKQFAQYRPSAEWNRASRRQGVANDYVLLQQEIGVGYNVLTTPARVLRLGVSQNLFDVWNTKPIADHTSRGVQSAFEEIELKLPWQMGLTQRGVWYPVRNEADGWENRIELNKKLTETLSASVRHEVRRHNPDGSAQDYTRLKLLFGLDF
jgi:hypothetical protein